MENPIEPWGMQAQSFPLCMNEYTNQQKIEQRKTDSNLLSILLTCGTKPNEWGHPMKLERLIIIYEALCFDVAQGRMNGAPNETRNTHI